MYLVLPDGSWVVGPNEADAREAVADLTHEHWNLSLDKRLYFGTDDENRDHPDLDRYVQVACGGVHGVPEGTYRIEHRAGSHLRHCCAFTSDAERIVQALIGFARLDETRPAGLGRKPLRFDDHTRALLR